VFRLFRENSAALHVRARADSPVLVDAWVENADGSIPVEASATPHNGEDLQGVYWGTQVFVANESLVSAGDLILPTPGVSFPGNFYKLRTGDYTHMGSYYPTSFPDDPFGGMDSFEVISW